MPNNPKNRTIVQVLPRLNAGGVERTTLDISEGIIARGWRSVIVVESGEYIEAAEKAGANVIKIPTASKNPLVWWRNISRLKNIFSSENSSLVHVRSRAPAWSAYGAAKGLKLPFVTTYHGIYNQGNAAKAFYNSVMARGDTVIANSAYTRTIIETRHPFAKGHVEVIHRGTDFSKFSRNALSADEIEAWRQKHGLSKRDELVLVHVARLTAWKGQKVTLKAAALLKQKGVPFKCLIVGGDEKAGRYREELEEMVRSYSLGADVIFTGQEREPAVAFAAGDLALSPSTDPEAFGRVAIEAQGVGTPVIASAHGAVPETVCVDEKEFTGWHTRPGDADDIAQAVLSWLKLSQSERNDLSARAISYAHQFSKEVMIEKTLAVYEKHLAST